MKLSIRLDLPDGSRFGPGKAALLQAIKTECSISGAARLLNMSYPRALKLIGQINESFTAPLVVSHHGGSSGGGAVLSEAGVMVLGLYLQICKDAEQATTNSISDIAKSTNPN